MYLPGRLLTVAVTAWSLLAFAACGGESIPLEPIVDPLVGATAEATISITLRDISFSEDVLTVESGKVIAVEIVNSGSLQHDFTIERIPAQVSATGQQKRGKFDVHVALARRQSATLLLRVTEPGDYIFFCSVPGHRGAGMEGTLIVRPSGAGD